MNPFKKTFIFLICICCDFATIANDTKNECRLEFIKDFISYYQTAYQKEKLQYIEQFFGNDALILTETKQLIKVGSEMVPKSSKSRPYHTVIADKCQYIDSLKEYFESHDKINIGISKLFITRHPVHQDIYGVNFFQVWDDDGGSSILENRMPGYIFLMIDFSKNELEPIIHVRTWQPKSNISQPSDKYTLTDFRIITAK